MRDTFLLKLLAVEAAILVTVGVLALMERDFFAWLFSWSEKRRPRHTLRLTALDYRLRTKLRASVTNNMADHENDISAPATIRCLVTFDIGYLMIFSKPLTP
jgi:hypothetical protein